MTAKGQNFMDKITKRLVVASSSIAILSGLSIISLIVVIAVPKLTERFFLTEHERWQASGGRTLSYSRFVEMVKEDGVGRVVISPDQGSAVIVEVDGRRAMVQLYPDQNLLQLLTDHQVDIAVKPND